MPTRDYRPRLATYGDGLRGLPSGRDRVAELLLRNGQAQAEAEMRGGEVWGNTIANIGQTLAGGIQQYGQQREQKKAQEAMDLARSTAYPSATKPVAGSAADVPDPGVDHIQAILSRVSPELRPRVEQGLRDFEDQALKSKEGRLQVQRLEQQLEETKKTSAQRDKDTLAVGAFRAKEFFNSQDGGLTATSILLQQAKAAGFDTSKYEGFVSEAAAAFQEAQQSGDPAALAAFVETFRGKAGPILDQFTMGASPDVMEKLRPKTTKLTSRDEAGNEVEEIVEDKPGVSRTSAAKVEPGSFEAYVRTKYGPRPTEAQQIKAREQWAHAGREPAQPSFQVKEVLDDAGKPVMANFDSRTGQFMNAATGQPIKNPRPTPVQQRLTKEERQDFAAWDYALPRLDGFVKYVEANPDKFGKWDSFKQEIKQAIPGLTDADFASNEAFITRINAEIRHAIFGAALTGGEQASAEGFLVEKGDQPAEIIAKVREAAARARSSIGYYRQLGFDLPQAPAAAGPENPFRKGAEKDTKAGKVNPFRR